MWSIGRNQSLSIVLFKESPKAQNPTIVVSWRFVYFLLYPSKFFQTCTTLSIILNLSKNSFLFASHYLLLKPHHYSGEVFHDCGCKGNAYFETNKCFANILLIIFFSIDFEGFLWAGEMVWITSWLRSESALQTSLHINKKVCQAKLNRLLIYKTAATYSPTICSTIGVVRLNFSVRNGKRWNPDAITTLIS